MSVQTHFEWKDNARNKKSGEIALFLQAQGDAFGCEKESYSIRKVTLSNGRAVLLLPITFILSNLILSPLLTLLNNS